MRRSAASWTPRPPPQPSYGWKEHLVNRRALRKSDGIASREEGLLGAGQSYTQQL